MPGKSRHGKKKHSAQSKKLRMRQSPSPIAVQQPVAAQTYEPATPSKAVTSSVKVPTPASTPMAVHYPYIVTELRTIGILAGITLVILVVLVLVLP